jgi:glycogen(starch) synthase
MTTDTLGGVFTYSMELCSWLSRRAVHVTLASMGRPLNEEQNRLARNAGVSVVESSYRLEWMDDPWEDVARAGQWLAALEQRLRPDIIHLNGYAHGALPWRAPVLMVGHSCVLSWWRAVLNEEAGAKYAHYREEVRRGLSRADVVVAPTDAMLASLRREYGELGFSRTIHNGVQLPAAEPGPKQPFVLSAGRLWDPAKNVLQLEHVAEELPWPVFVAGDAQAPDERGAQRLQHVHALGVLPRADLAAWLQRAAIFALPALYEPFGLAVLEAAAAGCALVLGDIPSLRELWAGCACFVDPRDPKALRAALQELIKDPLLRARLARDARRRARSYSAERMGSAYLGLYQSSSRPTRVEAPLESAS